jgi:hypothetical protein
MYDNAGENFLPGHDTAVEPGTQHLAQSSIMFFLFDPTQHPKLREACRKHSRDPQLKEDVPSHRQDLVLIEAASRIRHHTGMSQSDRYPRPLVVVVTKCDTWSKLVNNRWDDAARFVKRANDGRHALDLTELEESSAIIREMLLRYAAEIVNAAEGFSNEVYYLPVSATGTSPHSQAADGDNRPLVIRPKDIEPRFVEVPMLLALHRAAPGLIQVGRRPGSS